MLQANDEQEAAMRILGLRGDLIAEITAFAAPEVFPGSASRPSWRPDRTGRRPPFRAPGRWRSIQSDDQRYAYAGLAKEVELPMNQRKKRAAALACGVLLLAACGGSADRPSAQATTSSRPPSAAETCARKVGYWVAEALKPNTTTTYGDYQKMGLAGSDYELVVDITKEAKQLRKTATHEQTLAFVAEEARRRCARTVSTCTTAARYNGFPSC